MCCLSFCIARLASPSDAKLTSASPLGLQWNMFCDPTFIAASKSHLPSLLKWITTSTGSATELNHSAISCSVTLKGSPRMWTLNMPPLPPAPPPMPPLMLGPGPPGNPPKKSSEKFRSPRPPMPPPYPPIPPILTTRFNNGAHSIACQSPTSVCRKALVSS